MTSFRYIYLLFCLNFMFIHQGMAMLPAATPASAQPSSMHQIGQALRAPGWGEKIKIVRKIRKDLRMRGKSTEEEKASQLAWIALGTFAGYFFFSSLAVALTVPFLTVLASLAFLASLVMAIVILATEDNRKSKLIAKIILITYGVLLVLGLALILLLIAAFGG